MTGAWGEMLSGGKARLEGNRVANIEVRRTGSFRVEYRGQRLVLLVVGVESLSASRKRAVLSAGFE